MEDKKFKLCLGCMEMIPEEEPFCHLCGFNPSQYQGNPRCLRLGQKLVDKYIIGKVIGEGGFGITYIGWDTVLEMPVAIKEYFPSNIASRDTSYGANTINMFDGHTKETYEKGLQRYVKEAKNLSKFHYLQGIVSVRDFFYANATAYIVMEYINGITMKEHMKKVGRIPPEDVFKSLRPVMESLVKIHEKGIVHRDISPDNIMITRDGSVKLIDFGSARLTENGEKSLTVMLKRGFAPEEQYRSKGNQGPWTDVYALCATMYYMMAGKVPPEAMERLLTDELIPLEKLGVSIDEKKAQAVHKGLAVRANERWQSVEELMEALFGDDLQSEASESQVPPSLQAVPKEAVMVMEAKTLEEVEELSITMPVDEEEIQPTEMLVAEKKEISPTPEPTVVLQKKETKEQEEEKEEAKEQEEDLFSLLNDFREDKEDYAAESAKKKKLLLAGVAGAVGILLVVFLVSRFLGAGKEDIPPATTQPSSNQMIQEMTQTPEPTKTPESTPVPEYEIPDLKNKTIKQAEALLEELGTDKLSYERKDEYSNKVKKGRIISQSEEKGTLHTIEDEVTMVITVSKGVPVYKVPSVTGKVQKQAVKKMKARHLKVTITHEYSSSVKAGRVISQSIKEGKKVKKGTKVTLKISKGAKPAATTTPPSTTPGTTIPSTPTPPKNPSSGNNDWNELSDGGGW